MDAHQLPVGQSIILADTEYIKSVLTRISEKEIIAEQSDPQTGRVVLRSRLGVQDGSSAIEYLDLEFWRVVVDGVPMGVGILPEQASFFFDARNRTLNIETPKPQ